jgi:hypothetical protein
MIDLFLQRAPIMHFNSTVRAETTPNRVAKRRAWAALGIASVVVVAAVIAGLGPTLVAIWRLDGPSIMCDPTVAFITRTEYAPGYTHRAFAKLRRGMTQVDVRTLVGEPLAKQPEKVLAGDEMWDYSRGPTARSAYRARGVLFKGGVVVNPITTSAFCDNIK